MNDFGLKPIHIDIIKKTFEKILHPHQKITTWVFGSRARGTHRPFSDIDLLIESEPKFDSAQLSQLKEELEESNLPQKVDIVLAEELYAPYSSQVHLEKKLFFRL